MSDTAPVHLLVADDDHLLARSLEDLLAELVTADVEVLHVDATTAEHLPELRTGSLFGGRRCVVVRHAEQLSGTLAADVAAAVGDPPADAVIVLAARGTGRITTLAKAAASAGRRVDVKAPAPWAAREWEALVRDEFTRGGRQVDGAAVRAILDHAGLAPGVIASKVAQVVASTAVGARVGVEDVEAVVVGHGNRGGFAVADAVTARDPADALVALRGALEAGEDPLAVLGALTYRFRQLLQVRGGVRGDAMVPRKVSSGQYRHLEDDARRFGPGELAWCHDRLARADLELKGSELPGELLIELAVIDLATSREVGRPWNPRALT